MPPRDPENMEGSISYILGGIKNELESVTKTQAEDRIAAATYRTDIRAQLMGISDRQKDTSNEHAALRKEFDRLKVTVDSLDQRATMSRGAAKLAIALGKFAHVVTAALSALGAVLFSKWLSSGTPGH